MATVLGWIGWAVFGIFIGILSAMLGVGGGTVMVPAFRLVGGLSAVMSSATSLFVIVPTGVSGVWRHLKAKTCVIPIGLAAGLAGACTSVLGAKLADIAPGWTIIVVAFLVIVYSATNTLRKVFAKPAGAAKALSPVPVAGVDAPSAGFTVTRKSVITAAIIGLVAGVLSGFVGVGGGFIMVPLFCKKLGMDMKHAAGTSLLAIFCLATPAATAQVIMGNVDVAMGIAVAVGSIFGAVIGQRLGARMSDRNLRIAFAILLLVAATIMLANEFGLLG